MEATSSVNQYPIKSENDQFVDLSSNGPPYQQAYAQWNPQIQQSPVSEYPYAYAQPQSYSSTTQYADGAMYHQPQPSPTTDSSIRQGNPVSVPVTISTPLNSLGYPFGAGSPAYQSAAATNGFPSGTISRPPSVVHSPVHEAFASRGRSTSYSGPYFMQPALHQNGFSPIPPPSSFAHPMARMTMSHTASEASGKQQSSIPAANYYNSMMSPTSLEAAPSSASTPYEYMQEDPSPTPMAMSNGMSNGMSNSTHSQYHSLTPAPATAMYNYTSIVTPPQVSHSHQHQQQHQALPPPIPPLASSVATGGAPTIPRSMSMGNIPGGGGGGGGTPSASWFSGRTTPSGILTPGSALSRSTISRLGVVPSLTIPGNQFHDHRGATEYDMVYPPSSSSAAVSPSTPVVLSSLIRSGVGAGGNGTGSGPGTASNGGSVPLTPTTDDTTPFEYHPFPHQSFPRYTDSLHDGANGDEDDDGANNEDDEDDKMTMAIPHMNGSPRRGPGGVGATRTPKKRRSATIAAGPSAAVSGVTRSRSGTMVAGVGGAGHSGLAPASGLSAASLTMSPVDMHGHVSAASMSGFGMLGSSAAGSVNGSTNIAVGGQANSPLAMKELSPAHKPMIETYLNRYLNYLCVNPNAKDRMGHQIHQMYTARRIQRYEQLYGWRPLKFRIEAFVNGFVDLLTASGLSQDVTMKIPHYLNNSRLFSRFNESGNRMKSQGQTIWRVRARCRNDTPGVDAPPTGSAFHHHSPSGLSQQQQMHHQQQQAHHHQLIQQQQQQVQQQQQQLHGHDGSANGLMMAPEPLVWEFLPYERSIVGQPPLAIVGTAWQWNMKVHDHWTPRKKVNWSFVSNTSSTSPDNGAGSIRDGSDSSSPLSASASSSSSSGLPKWLSLQGSKLKGTPTEPGSFPISIEATFQEDNDPEPVVVRGTYTIQVSIGGWKTKVAIPHDGLAESPEGDHVSGGSADMGYGNDMGRGLGGGGNPGSAGDAEDMYPSLIEERTDQLMGMYSANQGSARGFQGLPYSYGYVH